MSTYDYAALRDGSVAALMTKFGTGSGVAKLVRWTKGAYDTATRSYGAGSVVEHDVTVVVTEYSVDEVDGKLVRRDDKRLIMGGAELAPIMNDKIKIGGVSYELIAVTPIQPDGAVVVAYILQVRK